MGATTAIEWTDHTFNPWIGCTKIHAGCTHCYAETLMDTRWGKVQWGPNGTRQITSEANWAQPQKWNREAAKLGLRRKVFCASLADVFEEWEGMMRLADGSGALHCPECHRFWSENTDVDCCDCGVWIDAMCRATMNDCRTRLFGIIDATPHLDWLILTKRPENIRRMWRPIDLYGHDHEGLCPRYQMDRSNVWLLTSISDQETADALTPELLKCRDLVPVLGVSAEPLVEHLAFRRIDLHRAGIDGGRGFDTLSPLTGAMRGPISVCGGSHLRLDWVIVGGESGPGARVCDIAWIRSIRDQCRAAGTACFIKQLGSNAVEPLSSFDPQELGTIPVTLRDSKGGDWNEWPEDLRVREFPQAI